MRSLLLLLSLLASPAVADTLIATRSLRPRQPILAADLAVEAGDVQPGALSDPGEVLGQELRAAVYKGQPILRANLAPAALVERNGIVTLLYQRGGIAIATEGRALDRGAAGEVIRVMNAASRATLSGVVTADGQVRILN
jgi:flagella basal body P-ring formation protein FlgA